MLLGEKISGAKKLADARFHSRENEIGSFTAIIDFWISTAGCMMFGYTNAIIIDLTNSLFVYQSLFLSQSLFLCFIIIILLI